MVYRSFRLNTSIRIVLLTATVLALAYVLLNTTLYATVLVISAAVIVQVYSLIKYVERTNQRLARFLESIEYSDFTQSFSSNVGGAAFNELNAAFSAVVEKFQKTREDKEAHHRYLQTVVQHVGLGLLAFDNEGQVDLINNATKRLLGISGLRNVKELSDLSQLLVDTLLKMRPGDRTLVKVDIDGQAVRLVVHATAFKLQSRFITLVSMQDIESELAEQEMLAWQKLIRVLTHEIMNSVTPIVSLASTVHNLISTTDESGHEAAIPVRPEVAEDVRQAVFTIEKRSRGLLHFTEAYRNLTRIPKPNFQIVSAKELLDRVIQLMSQELETGHIEISSRVEPETLELTADRDLIEQVLINLVLNSIQAMRDIDHRRVDLRSEIDPRGRIVICVTDNGHGISNDVAEKIFTPFYTTKKNGSGIGLSLSREIMRLHKGSITVQSTPDERTEFTLRF